MAVQEHATQTQLETWSTLKQTGPVSGGLYVDLNINNSTGDLPNHPCLMMCSLIAHCFVFLHPEMCSIALYLWKFLDLYFGFSRFVSCCPTPPVSQADSREITKAVRLLKTAQSPLIIIGKGMQNTTELDKIRKKFDEINFDLRNSSQKLVLKCLKFVDFKFEAVLKD